MKTVNCFLSGQAILVAGLLVGCRVDSRQVGAGEAVVAATSKLAEAPRRVPAVEVIEIKPGMVTGEQLIPAVTSVESTAMVLALRDGIITQLRAQEGTRVTQGEVIAQLNDDDLRVQLRQAELEIDRLKLEEGQYRALVNVSRSELEQEQALASDGLTSKRQVNRAEYRLSAATQELEKTQLASKAAQIKVEAVKIELAKAVIRAPITGILTRRYVKLGTGVVKNDKLFEVSQLSPLEVKFQLPQAERGKLGVGSTVKVALAESDRIVARARIRRIDPIADAASNTLGYLAEVLDGAGLIPGMAVNVSVPRATAASVLTVPRAAFPAAATLRSGTTGTLFVLEGDKCAARAVWVQGVEGEQVAINSGLAAGDHVILSPPAELRSGEAVEVKVKK
jgi:RND family efflux transporter MFP subunit